jgi:hypothetical protein
MEPVNRRARGPHRRRSERRWKSTPVLPCEILSYDVFAGVFAGLLVEYRIICPGAEISVAQQLKPELQAQHLWLRFFCDAVDRAAGA